MNARILEMADEAGIKFSAHWAHEGVDTAVIIRRDLKEFAELIVGECAKISLECGINLNREDFRQGIARNIKEHFGVK